MQVIQPPIQVGINKAYPLVFLAGPIQGASNWQSQVIKIFSDYNDVISVTIANPRRDKLDKTEFNYDAQVNWESKYLDKADIIMFWLPKPAEIIEGRSYAQTSRFELGEWFGKNPDRLVVGIEEGFDGERYIRKKLNDINITVYSSFKDTIKEVLRRIK